MSNCHLSHQVQLLKHAHVVEVECIVSGAVVAEGFDALADVSEVVLQAEGLVYSML